MALIESPEIYALFVAGRHHYSFRNYHNFMTALDATT